MLKSEEKGLSTRHKQRVAAIDALIDEQKGHSAALAVKRAPAVLPVTASVIVFQVPDETAATPDTSEAPIATAEAKTPQDFPKMLAAALASAKATLQSLEERRAGIVKDHAASASQLEEQATEASAANAQASARGAAQRRERAALERYETAIASSAAQV